MLELSVDTATSDLGAELLHIWPSYLAYVTSFLTIGVIWVNHHSLFDLIDRVDRTLLFLNTLLLLVVAFTPFRTSSSPSSCARTTTRKRPRSPTASRSS